MRRSAQWGSRFCSALCLILPVSAAATAADANADDKTLIEWRFDAAGDFRGWQKGAASAGLNCGTAT